MAVAQETLEQLRARRPRRRRSGDRRPHRPRARAAARADRADRVRELHLAERARGDRERADEQVRRGLSRQALLRRLRGVDEIEQLAIDRAKELFGAEHANVQPHAGAQTNMAVYSAVLEPGDTILGLRLDHGGHLTHGLKVNFSGRLYTFEHYGVSRETNVVDYDEVLALAKEHRPRLIVCGGSAYPRTVEADRFREIADEVGRDAPLRHGPFRRPRRRRAAPEPGAVLRLRLLDHAQDALRPALRLRPLPRGAREGARPRRLPGDAGRADGARDRREGDLLPDRRRAPRSASTRRRCARTPTRSPTSSRPAGSTSSPAAPTRTCSRSTCARSEWTGKDAEERLAEVNITANRNTVPFDERPPTVASGVRIGTPACTMRGFDEDDFREVGRIIAGALADEADIAGLAARAVALCEKRPLYPGFRGWTTYERMSGRRAHASSPTRSSSTSSRTCATRTRRPSTSASSPTR